MGDDHGSAAAQESDKGAGRFPRTSWSLVLKAQAGSIEAANILAESYWPAVYTFLRQKGCSPEDSADLTQVTFSQLLGDGHISDVDKSKGRFRSYICACALHHTFNQQAKGRAAKRDVYRTISIDPILAEEQFQTLPQTSAPADHTFDRAWSQIVVRRALDRVRGEYRRLGSPELAEILIARLSGSQESETLVELAEFLKVSHENARKIWTRFRHTFLRNVRAEVADTVATADDVEPELRHLLQAWLGGLTPPQRPPT